MKWSAMAKNFEITCPCCESLLVIDRLSGEILLHKEKERKSSQSLEAMVSNLDKQKSEMAKKFDKQIESQKDRSRILEEKFKEAMERVDKDKPYINPMDLD
jgi:sulfate adenylyltransferase subunit 1 (EFTu-like GTPase family)